MRIIILLSAFALLAACTKPETQYVMTPKDPVLATAKGYCTAQGYASDTYNYVVCYNNHPTVQAAGRASRLSELAIVKRNRSPVTTGARSYPVN